MTRRRLLVWVLLLVGAVLVGAAIDYLRGPACIPGSLKGERGEIYFCQDGHRGGRWVKQ